jgi:DNA-binding NtrC family response regulator
LQEREIERVGGNKTIGIEVRVIAATNRDLESMIGKGGFRSDLFYRLNVFPIEMPPLRNRKEDIPLLLSHFIDLFAERIGKRVTSIQPTLVDQLKAHSWPGNIREVQNLMERAVALADSEIISHISLPPSIKPPGVSSNPPLPRSLEELERNYILTILQQCNNRVSGEGGAAEYLRIPPSTLYSRLKKLGISQKQIRHFLR